MASGRRRSSAEGTLAFALRRRRLRRRYRKTVGPLGSFENPRSYEEKINFRKLYGNHETYAEVADKLRVRDIVAERVGAQYLVPLLGVYERLQPEDFDPLPRQFIIKPNHGCGWNRIVRDKRELDVEETIRCFDLRVSQTFGRRTGEFHYGLIEPRLLVEELLLDDDRIPLDYNFYCYHHRGSFDYVLSLRFPDGRASVHFDRELRLLEGDLEPGERERIIESANLDEMVRLSRALSEGFDFIRVDLYDVRGRIYFGELTCTPASGLNPVTHEQRAAMRTDMWHIDADNPHLYRKPRAWRGEPAEPKGRPG